MTAQLRRLATFTPDASPATAIIIELTDDTQVAISQSVAAQATVAQLQTVLRTGIGRTDIFVHRNRDATLALAIGAEPSIWPEDDVYPDLD